MSLDSACVASTGLGGSADEFIEVEESGVDERRGAARVEREVLIDVVALVVLDGEEQLNVGGRGHAEQGVANDEGAGFVEVAEESALGEVDEVKEDVVDELVRCMV